MTSFACRFQPCHDVLRVMEINLTTTPGLCDTAAVSTAVVRLRGRAFRCTLCHRRSAAIHSLNIIPRPIIYSVIIRCSDDRVAGAGVCAVHAHCGGWPDLRLRAHRPRGLAGMSAAADEPTQGGGAGGAVSWRRNDCVAMTWGMIMKLGRCTRGRWRPRQPRACSSACPSQHLRRGSACRYVVRGGCHVWWMSCVVDVMCGLTTRNRSKRCSTPTYPKSAYHPLSHPIPSHARLSGQRLKSTLVSFLVATAATLLASIAVGLDYHYIQHRSLFSFPSTWYCYVGGVWLWSLGNHSSAQGPLA